MPKTRSQARVSDNISSTKGPANASKKITRTTPLSKMQLRNMLSQKLVRHQKSISLQQDSKNKIPAQLLPLKLLGCPICLETPVFPTLTQCGHTFCLPCAEESLRYKRVCSLCRSPLQFHQFKPSPQLQSLLQQKLQMESDSQVITSYKQRVQAFQQQDNDRRVTSQLKQGDMIDFWSQYKWRDGKVTAITNSSSGTFYKIKGTSQYNTDPRQELNFQSNSRLLAKYRTFTKEELSHPRHSHFRIQILNLADTNGDALSFNLLERRQMEVSFQDVNPTQNTSFRLAFSFHRRNN